MIPTEQSRDRQGMVAPGLPTQYLDRMDNSQCLEDKIGEPLVSPSIYLHNMVQASSVARRSLLRPDTYPKQPTRAGFGT
jgi:hypothetical protein